MPAQLLGAHMPTSGGLGTAIRKGKEIGCTAIQVFTSSPQQWKSKEITGPMVDDFKAAQKETAIDCVVSHDSYLINLCAPDMELREKSRNGLLSELNRCARYGIRWTVSHMGAHMGQGEEEGLKAVAESAQVVIENGPKDVMLLMETTAGQGSSLNYKFEHLAFLLDAIGSDRVGVCLDTCHIFVAGYDIRTREAYEATFAEFDRIVGLGHLKAIHCNDSKKPLGSKVDRHEAIGKGEIGEPCFRLLVNDPRFVEVPILLETPEAETMHAVNLALLRSFQTA